MLLEPGKHQRIPQIVTVTQDQGIKFQVTISEFDIQPGDITSYKWHDGTAQHYLEMPSYLICDVEGATRNMLDATLWGRDASVNLLLRDANSIQKKTIEVAKKYLESTQVGCQLTFNHLTLRNTD